MRTRCPRWRRWGRPPSSPHSSCRCFHRWVGAQSLGSTQRHRAVEARRWARVVGVDVGVGERGEGHAKMERSGRSSGFRAPRAEAEVKGFA